VAHARRGAVRLGEQYLELGGAQVDRFLAGLPDASGCTDRPTEAAEAEGESAIGRRMRSGPRLRPKDSTAEVADDLTRRAQPGLVSPSSPTNDLHKLVNKEGGVNRAGLLPKRSNSLGSLRAFE
jgi:hypothetical protein